jgi:hypothetical protein
MVQQFELSQFTTEKTSLNHAHFILQSCIDKEESKLQSLRDNIDRMAELAVARFSSKNSRGAILSMRKYHKLLEMYQLQTCVVPALRQLDDDISRGVVSLDQFDRELENIVNFQADDMAPFRRPLLEDDALLSELVTGNFVQRPIDDRQEKSFSLANPAA